MVNCYATNKNCCSRRRDLLYNNDTIIQQATVDCCARIKNY